MTESPTPMLRSSKDWPEWKDHIHKTATLLDIWDHCDPATEKEDLPALKEPERPSMPYDVVDLDEKEFEEFATQVSSYRKELAAYDEKRFALDTLEDLIHYSISDACQQDVFGSPARMPSEPWEQLRALSDVFDRPSREKIRELQYEWLRLRDVAEKPQFQDYMRRWDKLFKHCASFRMVKSSSKESRDSILLDALRRPASGSGDENREGLGDQPWIVMPKFSDSETETDQEEKAESYWDFLSNAEIDDKPQSQSPCEW